MEGRIIVIEGADATGKKTTAKEVVKRINESGLLGENRAHYMSFPNYESPWGRVIKELYLAGELGELSDVDPLAAALLYSADRHAQLDSIEDIMQSGDWIIFDRYLQSNFPHQGVKIEDENKRDEFVELLQKIEYEYLDLPRPATIILLHLSNTIRFQRSGERGSEDLHESNRGYMAAVSEEYLRLAQKFGWHVVDCSPSGEQLPPDEIAGRIWKKIAKDLNKVHF